MFCSAEYTIYEDEVKHYAEQGAMPPDSSTRAQSEPPAASASMEQGAMPSDSHASKGKGKRSSSTPTNKGYERGSAAAAEQPFNVFGDFFLHHGQSNP